MNGGGALARVGTRAGEEVVDDVNSCLTGPLLRAVTGDEAVIATGGTRLIRGTEVCGWVCVSLSTAAWLLMKDASFRSECRGRWLLTALVLLAVCCDAESPPLDKATDIHVAAEGTRDLVIS